MAIRKHRAGELVIEQTRDLALVRAMLARGGMTTDGIEWPAACYIVAYFGDEAVGVIGVEPKVDAALIRSLVRGRIDAAARNRRRVDRGGAQGRAHARRASSVFVQRGRWASSSSAGFTAVPVADVIAALPGVPQVEFYRARPDELAREVAYHLDISADGVIER